MQKTLGLSKKEKEALAISGEKTFQIMYVSNENESVAVNESATIDFSQVIDQLNKGNSIFIAPKLSCAQPSKAKKQRRISFINHV